VLVNASASLRKTLLAMTATLHLRLRVPVVRRKSRLRYPRWSILSDSRSVAVRPC
jgi:hypothetical protein